MPHSVLNFDGLRTLSAMPAKSIITFSHKIRARIMRARILVITFYGFLLPVILLSACSTQPPEINESMRLKLGSMMPEFRKVNPQWNDGTLEMLPSAPGTLRLLFRGNRLDNLEMLSELPIVELIFDRVELDDLNIIAELNLESLQIFSNTAINLNGIEHQRNLRHLSIRFLSENPCSVSLTPLSNLPLTRFTLTNAAIDTPIPSLPELENCSLDYCAGIDDFTFLLNSKKLNTLELNACSELNLNTMPPVPIKQLSLRYSSVKNLSALNKLHNLRMLTVSEPGNLDFIRDLKLTSLTVINSAKPLCLKPLINSDIAELELINCPLLTVEPLAQCENLKTLNLTLNQISDITPLSGTQIKNLFLGGNPIRNLEALTQCRLLRQLFISQCPVSSLEPLSALPLLKNMKIEKTLIYSLEPLTRTALEEIWLSECPISDLEPLTKIRSLKKIQLRKLPALQNPIPKSIIAKTTVDHHE